MFWFSLEFGVLREDGGSEGYGAGLLSSYGEIEEIARADLRPLDIARDGRADVRHHALPADAVLRATPSSQVEDVVGGFFAAVDDDSVARLHAVSAAS